MGFLRYFLITYFMLVSVVYSASILQINGGVTIQQDKASGQSNGLHSLVQTVAHGQNASSQSFHITNDGGGILAYYLYDNVSWLTCVPESGEVLEIDEHDLITVNYSTSKLKVGNYKGRIYARSNGGWAFIDVFLTVTN